MFPCIVFADQSANIKAQLQQIELLQKLLAEQGSQKETVQPTVTFDERPISVLYQESKDFIISKKYDKAINDLRSIILTQPPNVSREAHELLGLAYEKIRDFDKAKNEYSAYLSIYPEQSEDRTRVRQRLMGLEILVPQQSLLSNSDKKPRSGNREQFSASFSQYFYVDSNTPGMQFNRWKTDQLNSITGIQGSWRIDHNQYSILSKIRLNEVRDLLDNKYNRKSLSLAYTQFEDTFKGYSLTLGRQPSVTGAVSRFDGLSSKFYLNSDKHMSLVFASGIPYSGVNTNTNRRFIGSSFIWDISDKWKSELYINRQTADGLLERMALGTDLEYKNNKQTYLVRTEYDNVYHTLNQITFQGIQYFDTYNVFLVYEKRKSPFPYADVALGIGGLNNDRQIYNSVSELLEKSGLSRPEIYTYIASSTQDATNLVVGSTKDFNKNWSLTTDFQITNLSTTPGYNLGPNFDPVPLLVGMSNIYSGDFHLRGDNFIKDNNTIEFVVSDSFGNKKAFFVTLADIFRFGDQKANSVSAIVRYDKYSQGNGIDTKTAYGILRLLISLGQNGTLESQYSRSITYSPYSGVNSLNTNQTFYLGYRYDF